MTFRGQLCSSFTHLHLFNNQITLTHSFNPLNMMRHYRLNLILLVKADTNCFSTFLPLMFLCGLTVSTMVATSSSANVQSKQKSIESPISPRNLDLSAMKRQGKTICLH